ncbi:MAG: Hsp33 family molecular chaperone HslO [Gammaproteobacteria bacterium]|nr:Hsp33 family molecular chaperone HslO [Gammaproteobacteria bacterium]
MRDPDSLHRFLFERYPIRGHLVRLDASWRALLERRDYPPAIRDTLGEAVAASALLAATLKFDGTLSLQLQGQGPLYLLVAQCTNDLAVRGVARYREAVDSRDLSVLSGKGQLSVTVEGQDLPQRYQGVVPLAGPRLAECLQAYFDQSEQLPTRLWLHAEEAGAYGMLLQRLPVSAMEQGNGAPSPRTPPSPEEIDDAWRRVQLLGDTLKPEELATLSERTILRRLFPEDDVRLFEPAPVFFRCRCSRERVINMLRALGSDDLRALLAERGKVEVRCDFCNRAYEFDAVDVEHFLSPQATSGSERRH